MPTPPPDRLPGTGGDNWLDPPHSEWAVWHLDEIADVAPVRRGAASARPLPRAEPPVPIRDIIRAHGTGSVGDVLAETSTDAFLVLHDGVLLHEEYAHPELATTPHAVLSVSKSVVGCIAGLLAERGVLDLQAPVHIQVPELLGCGYGDATPRDLLDMRSGVRFVEAYTDPDSDINEMDRRLLDEGLHSYLRTLPQERPHGGAFRYRSSETDVLGWACEQAAGATMPQLVSDLLWQPMGAEFDAYFSCDVAGAAIHDGGLAATGRDLARFGQLLLDGGTVPSLTSPSAEPDEAADASGPRRVLPSRWLRNAWGVDSDIRSAFLDSPAEYTYPGGWYRNQFWFRPGANGDVLMCIGIHGQLIHVCRRTRTVCVKLSHWPEPVDLAASQATLDACESIGAVLAGGGHRPRPPTGRGIPGIAAGLQRGTPTGR